MSEKIARILKLRGDEDIIEYNILHYYNIGIKDQFIMLHLPSKELLDILSDIQVKYKDLHLYIMFHDIEGKGKDVVNWELLKVLTDAAMSKGFKWIIGSDADEFLILKKYVTIQEFLQPYYEYESVSLLFEWVNYYIKEYDTNKKFYQYMTVRRPYSMPWTKCSGKFKEGQYFCQGIHHIAGSTNDIKVKDSDAYYAHFPFRSKKQFSDKNLIQAVKFKDWRYGKTRDFFEEYFEQNYIKGNRPSVLGNDFIKDESNNYINEEADLWKTIG